MNENQERRLKGTSLNDIVEAKASSGMHHHQAISGDTISRPVQTHYQFFLHKVHIHETRRRSLSACIRHTAYVFALVLTTAFLDTQNLQPVKDRRDAVAVPLGRIEGFDVLAIYGPLNLPRLITHDTPAYEDLVAQVDPRPMQVMREMRRTCLTCGMPFRSRLRILRVSSMA